MQAAAVYFTTTNRHRVCVCVFSPLDTSLTSLLTAAMPLRDRQRTASVLSRWPNMTWLSRLPSSLTCDSAVTPVELAGSGSQANESLAQLEGKGGVRCARCDVGWKRLRLL